MPKIENLRIAPADGKLGVLIPGIGAVPTTFIAGVEAVVDHKADEGSVRSGVRQEDQWAERESARLQNGQSRDAHGRHPEF
ncbi:MAG: hypothetical protein M3Y27_08010 [Acidobacteriota bacterium]|nr:hypothetical protein [Acidobacteriota bacterium]